MSDLGEMVSGALGWVGARSLRLAVDDVDVIEAIARAIATADDRLWDRLQDEGRLRYRRLARAAVTELAAQTADGVRGAFANIARGPVR
jgi:hypothetical protein